MDRSSVALQPRLGADPRAAGLPRALSLALCAALTLLVVVAAALATSPAVHAGPLTPFTITVGSKVTNKIYVANNLSGNVTVIDGATNTVAATVAAGTTPNAVAVNAVTNKVYVANSGGNTVTVIDGATNTVDATVTAEMHPQAVAVDPVTNKIYVTNKASYSVTVIDGATNVTTTVAAGTDPLVVAVNPVTNKIYVSNSGSNNVTVIDGATSATTTVAVGTNPDGVAVNPLTNKVYVANTNSNTVTVIDGATNATTTVAVGDEPVWVAVNPVTNRVYVANYFGNSVSVIDGATNAVTATVPAGTNPRLVAVNPVTNKVYASNASSSNVTVIDGTTNLTTTVSAGTSPNAVTVNPVTNRAYVVNRGSHNVTVIDEQLEQPVPLTVAITPLTHDRASSTTPTFSFSAATTFAPTAPPVMNVYYQVDTFQGRWLKATPDGATSSGTTPALSPGLHILYAFAADGMTADSVQTGQQSAPLVGSIAAYVFLVDSTYTIVPSVVGGHGTISPALTQSVAVGASQTFTFSPELGYNVRRVLVDGSPVAYAGNRYTFTNVTADHTISVEFALGTFTISASAGPHGSIAPAGNVRLALGGAQSYVITPEPGYHVAEVRVDGRSVGAVTSYAFTNVTASHTISATFAVDTYAISALVGTAGHGRVTPAGTQTVAWGATPTYTFTPERGYYASRLTLDGVVIAFSGPNRYTFAPVTGSHVLQVFFTVAPRQALR